MHGVGSSEESKRCKVLKHFLLHVGKVSERRCAQPGWNVNPRVVKNLHPCFSVAVICKKVAVVRKKVAYKYSENGAGKRKGE